jgi:hypothetical protein
MVRHLFAYEYLESAIAYVVRQYQLHTLVYELHPTIALK